MKNQLWQTALPLMVTLSGWIAGPIIVALIAGNWFDDRYHSAPWGVLGFIGVAFIISNIGIVKQGRKMMHRMEQESTTQTNGKTNPKQPK